MVSVTVFDAANTIGGNKIYLEEKNEGVFLDFGMNFAKYGVYFKEFLSERSSRGIYDLIHLNLIPKLNIYRRDLIPNDLDTSNYLRLNPKAVLLSHAHLDHCGNIGLLSEDIPVVASPTSVAILKAWRDCSAAKMGSEISYYSHKIPVIDTKGMVLESDRKTNYIGRNFYCTSNVSDELIALTSKRPGQDSPRAKGLDCGEICDVGETDLPFEVKGYPVDHSLYGANGFIVKGDSTVAYTGDIRLHGKQAKKTKNFLDKAKEASVLIIEGTRVGREEDEEISEESVHQKCYEAVENYDGLIVADFSARNFERLETFIDIAAETGRELLVTAKDAYMLHAIGCVEGVCRMDHDAVSIYGEIKDRRRIKWETEIVQSLWGSKYISPQTISKTPDEFIICFSLYDLKHLLDLLPEEGRYIYSSSEAFTEDQIIDFEILYHWLQHFNLKPVGFSFEKGDLGFDKEYHASGHVSMNEIREIIEQVDAESVIPVHTEKPEWFENSFDNVVLPENGKKINI